MQGFHHTGYNEPRLPVVEASSLFHLFPSLKQDCCSENPPDAFEARQHPAHDAALFPRGIAPAVGKSGNVCNEDFIHFAHVLDPFFPNKSVVGLALQASNWEWHAIDDQRCLGSNGPQDGRTCHQIVDTDSGCVGCEDPASCNQSILQRANASDGILMP